MLHHHTSRRSDDLPSQKNILQAEGLDLLPVFRRPYHINLEQQKQIVSQHHQLEDCLIIACRPQPGNGPWELLRSSLEKSSTSPLLVQDGCGKDLSSGRRPPLCGRLFS